MNYSDMIEKAKYISRKKVKGKWVYKYADDKKMRTGRKKKKSSFFVDGAIRGAGMGPVMLGSKPKHGFQSEEAINKFVDSYKRADATKYDEEQRFYLAEATPEEKPKWEALYSYNRINRNVNKMAALAAHTLDPDDPKEAKFMKDLAKIFYSRIGMDSFQYNEGLAALGPRSNWDNHKAVHKTSKKLVDNLDKLMAEAKNIPTLNENKRMKKLHGMVKDSAKDMMRRLEKLGLTQTGNETPGLGYYPDWS